MSQLFHTYLYLPLLNLLIFIYNAVPYKDVGVTIIIITIAMRAALWPLSKKTIEAQKKMKELQPKIAELNEKYKDDKQKKALETMRLYKENNANPVSSCLPLLIQLPILWAVFRVFRDGFKPESITGLYGFVAKPETINHFFLSIHFLDLSKPNILLSILAAAAQYWQGSMLGTAKPALSLPGSRDESMQTAINKQMLYMMPIVTLIFGLQLPGGLMLYWFVSTLLMGLQQWLQFRTTSTL